MLVSEYISRFFRDNGIKHIFGYPGGMVTYLMRKPTELLPMSIIMNRARRLLPADMP